MGRNYTDEDILRFVPEVTSIAGLLRKLDLKAAGGNYHTIRALLLALEADTSHWVGQGWSRGLELKPPSSVKRASTRKKHLLVSRGHRCEVCGLSTWFDRPMPLEIHHIDGDPYNNVDDNLQLLCPNCHAFTDNWKGRNIRVSSNGRTVGLEPTQSAFES